MWQFLLKHALMDEEGGGDPPGGPGGGGAPTGGGDTVEVELWGTKVQLPKAEADRVIAERDRRTAEFRELQQKVGQTEAQAQAAREKAEREERERQALEAAKKGELQEARRLLAQEHQQESQRLQSELTRLHLSNALRSRKNVADKAVDTIAKLLLTDQQFAVKDGELQVLSADGRPLVDSAGQPVKTDAWLDKWLENNDYFLTDTTPRGDGSAGGGKPPEGVEVLSREEYEKRIASEDTRQATLQGVGEGKIKLRD